MAVPVAPPAAVDNQRLGGSGIERRRDPSHFAGQVDFFQGHGVSQQVAAGGIPSLVAIVVRLRWPLMRESAVPAPREVKVPGTKFLHPRTGSGRTGWGHSGHGPQDVKEVTGVAGVPLRAVGGHAHA